MLQAVLSIFQSKSIHRLSMLFTMASQIAKTFEQEFAQDHDAKNAAIDTLIQILEKHKTESVTNDSTPSTNP